MIKVKFKNDDRVLNWHEDDVPYFSFGMLDELGVPNAYTTRYASYDSTGGKGEKGIRVACMSGEDVEEARSVISENMSKLSAQLGSDIDHVCITNQKHTANVKVIRAGDVGYWKSVDRSEPIDGVVTNVPNACLVVYGADCPSVYIVDPVNKAIGLVHAGWKGTFGKIPEVAVRMMVEEYGSNPADLYAAVGPGICQDCYEMGDEIYGQLAELWGSEDADLLMKRYPSGKYHLDLWTANSMTLERSGIPADHIAVTNLCTCCNSDEMYSYRARRMENEQAALLVNRIEK